MQIALSAFDLRLLNMCKFVFERLGKNYERIYKSIRGHSVNN